MSQSSLIIFSEFIFLSAIANAQAIVPEKLPLLFLEYPPNGDPEVTKLTIALRWELPEVSAAHCTPPEYDAPISSYFTI